MPRPSRVKAKPTAAPRPTRSQSPYIKFFSEVNMKDVAVVGGKNASLGEMYQNLVKHGVRVPGGFAVTADGYWRLLDASGLRPKIAEALRGLDTKDVEDLARRGSAVRQLILGANVPDDLKDAVAAAYRQMTEEYGGHEPDVAVRSSATAEDLPGASFAGQQETYLNIRGEYALVDAVKRCCASLFTNRAIAYRVEKGFDHLKVALSCAVQKMVRSDLAAAGVMFTIDTESGFDKVVLVNASYGLGESVVQGKVTPDQYYVFKPLLDGKHRPIIGRYLGSKETKIVYSMEGGDTIRTVQTTKEDRLKYCLTDDEVLTLARWGVLIEEYYSKLAKEKRPMDIEWAKDGETGELFIVQARPETVQSGKDRRIMEEYLFKNKPPAAAVTGLSVGSKIAVGKVHVIRDIRDMASFRDGEVLVTEMTDPDWVPIMKRAAAIVTNSGGRTCHAAIVSRELGTPAVVGTRDATAKLRDGQVVTVSCAAGDEGTVYDGALPFEVRRTELKGWRETRTKIMMNVGEPDLAFEHSFIPNSGVGLARIEFVFTNFIKAHPLALLNYDSLKDAEVKRQIDELTYAYPDKETYFVSRLAEGIGRIAAAFWPNEVIVRSSDFKTNEYASLLGGKDYEPVESNPMIGWRGASRYYDPKYKAAFLLECAAFRKVREEMGLTNLTVMIPFCRTVEEGKKVQAVMAEAGLRRGKNGLKLYVMCEIPSNVILADEFAKIFDGFSIGSNDLTQLTLGVDRDSGLVSHLYDERNEAVKTLIRQVIRAAKRNKVKVGICGQAPSDYPDFAAFLVEEGIDSISLNPDTVLKTSQVIARMEEKMGRLRKMR
jgi:pyruvate,water dikinase